MEADLEDIKQTAQEDKKATSQRNGNLAEERLKLTPQESWAGDESDDSSAGSDREFQQEVKSQKPASEKQTDAEDEVKSNQNLQYPNKKKQYRRRKYLRTINDSETTYLKHEHRVEEKTLILIRWMYIYNKDFCLEELVGLEDGEIYAQTRQGKLFVRAKTQQVIKSVVQKLSDFIDQLNVVVWPLCEPDINKFSQLKKIKKELRDKNIYLFKSDKGNRDKGSLLIGGALKHSQLSNILSTVKSYKVFYIHLRSIRATRTYKLIMNTILDRPEVCDELSKYNQTKTVDIVHSNDIELKLVVCTFSRKNVPPQDYEQLIMTILRRYFVLIFAFQTEDSYIPKLNSPNQKITFKIIREKKFQANYLMILCLEKDFYNYEKEIASEIEKIDKFIYGIRFFSHIQPTMSKMNFEKAKYYYVAYPKHRPYSNIVFARSKFDYTFDWKEFYSSAVALNNEKRIKQQVQ